jgi:5-formyltetrahydrofolate cyclo-ligase
MNKAELRKKMIFIRDSLSIEERKTKSHAIKSHLTKLKAYQDAEVVFVYVSFRSEVDTRCFIKEAKKNGKRIAVPISIPKGKVLQPCEISGLDELVPGTWGILEPIKENCRPVDSKEIDIAVVPGLAFDNCFHRLGYGAGYYDRFLPSLRKNAIKIGLGYDFQLLDRLPVEEFDVPLSGIITEDRLLLENEFD